MLPRRESVPFAFIAEADAFRSDDPKPRRERASAGDVAGRVLVGVLVVAGLVGSILFGVPALDNAEELGSAQNSQSVRD